MNRHDRRAAQAQGTIPRELVERAEKEGYVVFRPGMPVEQLIAKQQAVLAQLDDLDCLSGFNLLLTLTAMLAVYGATNNVDGLEVITRDAYLKNCAEKYDAFAKTRDQKKLS